MWNFSNMWLCHCVVSRLTYRFPLSTASHPSNTRHKGLSGSRSADIRVNIRELENTRLTQEFSGGSDTAAMLCSLQVFQLQLQIGRSIWWILVTVPVRNNIMGATGNGNAWKQVGESLWFIGGECGGEKKAWWVWQSPDLRPLSNLQPPPLSSNERLTAVSWTWRMFLTVETCFHPWISSWNIPSIRIRLFDPFTDSNQPEVRLKAGLRMGGSSRARVRKMIRRIGAHSCTAHW